MALVSNRRDRIDRIEARIGRLRKRACKLLEREQRARAGLEELLTTYPSGRLRRSRHARLQERSEKRLESLRERRERLIEEEVQSILKALQDQSQRTRERLDRELRRLAPIEAEWDRLRGTFDDLDESLAEPALAQLGSRWRGELQIPEFPVREHEGYPKPFPQGAVVF
jgi:chromosome segregation ATPase